MGEAGNFARIHLDYVSYCSLMNSQNGSPCLSVSLVDTWQIDFGNELNGGRVVWITVATVEVDAVNSVLMHALYLLISPASFLSLQRFIRTCGGPSIVPFQLVIIMSSPSARPYEQASANLSVCVSPFADGQ